MLKTKEPSVQTATAENDIALIHQFTRNELKPEEVYCFSVTLCDNEIDRDMEQISDVQAIPGELHSTSWEKPGFSIIIGLQKARLPGYTAVKW